MDQAQSSAVPATTGQRIGAALSALGLGNDVAKLKDWLASRVEYAAHVVANVAKSEGDVIAAKGDAQVFSLLHALVEEVEDLRAKVNATDKVASAPVAPPPPPPSV